jgi:hypothetical protein
MDRFFVPARAPEDWTQSLMNTERKGCSPADSVARAWQRAGGFPTAVLRVLEASGEEALQGLEILAAFPEYELPLLVDDGPSTSELFVLAKGRRGLVSVMVEGTAAGAFGPMVCEWLVEGAKTKMRLLSHLCEVLGVDIGEIQSARYRLFLEAAGALVVAERFEAATAVMMVHSFAGKDEGFQDYSLFCRLFGTAAVADGVVEAHRTQMRRLFFSWVRGVD